MIKSLKKLLKNIVCACNCSCTMLKKGDEDQGGHIVDMDVGVINTLKVRSASNMDRVIALPIPHPIIEEVE